MKTIKALVASLVLVAVSSVAFAGSETGSGTYNRVAAPYGKTVIYERYVGGETARIALHGSGVSDLDIYVYNAAGRLVVSGTGYSDREVVSFFPLVSGSYRIEIVNRGSRVNPFIVGTN